MHLITVYMMPTDLLALQPRIHSKNSAQIRQRPSRWRVQPDGGHSSRPTSRQRKPPVAPQPPHVTI